MFFQQLQNLHMGLAMISSRLDELTLAAAWAEGRAMTWEEAVEYALGEVIPC